LTYTDATISIECSWILHYCSSVWRMRRYILGDYHALLARGLFCGVRNILMMFIVCGLMFFLNLCLFSSVYVRISPFRCLLSVITEFRGVNCGENIFVSVPDIGSDVVYRLLLAFPVPPSPLFAYDQSLMRCIITQ